MRKWGLVLLSVVLGVASGYGIAALKAPSYNERFGAVADVLSLPGGIISFIFYPAGVHTGVGSVGWAWIALLGNWLCYTLIWFLALWGLSRVTRGRGSGK